MMRWMRVAALAMVAALAPIGAGCGTLAGVSGYEDVASYDDKAILTVEVAYEGALNAILIADQAGVLTPEIAEDLLTVTRKTQTAVELARKLYDDGETLDAAVATGDATQAVGALVQLLMDYGLIQRAQ